MRTLLVVFIILIATQTLAAEPVLLWNTSGDSRSYDQMRAALKAGGGHVVHAYPPYCLAGYFEAEELRGLTPTVRHLRSGDIQGVVDVMSPEASGFALAWMRMLVKKAEPRAISENVAPILDDVRMREPSGDRAAPNGTPMLYGTLPYGAYYMDTSSFMIGDVSVSVIFPESNLNSPNTENWDDSEIITVKSEIMNALNWWALREPSAHLTFIYNYEERVDTNYEPISLESSWDWDWMNEIMLNLGYGPEQYPPDPLLYDYINYQREEKSADWGFMIFVVDSSNDLDGMFEDGYFAYTVSAALGQTGPYFVMTYDNNGYGIGNMDAVAAHETGHIFGAADQYSSSGCSCVSETGYLYIENQNCNNACLINEDSIMRSTITSFANNLVDIYARGQIGWKDTDSDGILDIEDTCPILTVVPPDTQTMLSFQVHGSSVVTWLPSPNPYYNDISINTISGVRYRIDGGPWLFGAADDGSFNEAQEDLTMDVTAEEPGTCLLECQAINDVGNFSEPITQVYVVVTGPPSYVLTVNVVGLGTVTKSPDQSSYLLGDSVVVTAVPDAGWVFDVWSGGLNGAENPDTIVMESDTVVTATFELATSVGEHAIPRVFALYQNVPNPFNPTTVIRYDVPPGGGTVTLRVFGVSGKIVRTLVDGVESPGEKTTQWDGRNERGEQVSTGVYFYRLTAGDKTLTKKMILLK